MPNTIEDHLTLIDQQLSTGERAEPEGLLLELIRQIGAAELADWRQDIMKLVDKFQKKRRRNLVAAIEKALGGGGERSVANAHGSGEVFSISPDSRLVVDFQLALDKLREHHIYQWSTFYRDTLNFHFSGFLDEMERLAPDDPGAALSEPLYDHAHKIFSSGYEYVRVNHSHKDAVQKSINGISRFLELPIAFYSARSSSVSGYPSTFALRLLVSAAVSGILRGYSSVQFHKEPGTSVLLRHPRSWLRYMAFLTPAHATSVIYELEAGELRDGLECSVLPLLDAIQKFFDRIDDDYFPLPITGLFSWYPRRFELAVRPPHDSQYQRLIEADAYLDAKFISPVDLEGALGRQVSVVIAPLRPDVQETVAARPALDQIVIPADKKARAFIANQAFRILDDNIYSMRSKRKDLFPITYNFAREFPLRDQNKAQFFHVARTSVRDLLRTFERRNGARLWCSVRRSGKTTACFDLESAEGDSTIVSQTCGATQSDSARMFYDRVETALDSGKRIPATFVNDVIRECAPIDVRNRRMVLIIDEYETLFGLLNAALQESSSVQYAIVQPVLDQLVSFAYDNLLVFLGQQPDAHFILMEQNQLAPYVEQDPFPLFEHRMETATGEFSELVRKILGGRIECNGRFVDALFQETAGHPFLTANVLVEFVDWLIEQRRSQKGLRVDQGDFEEFESEKLVRQRIELSQEYEFFRNAAADAMSLRGFQTNPWLYTTYWTIHLLSNRRGVGQFRAGMADFRRLTRRIPVPGGGILPSWTEILRTASQANFLSQQNDDVNVRVRTLGRIAATVRPTV